MTNDLNLVRYNKNGITFEYDSVVVVSEVETGQKLKLGLFSNITVDIEGKNDVAHFLKYYNMWLDMKYWPREEIAYEKEVDPDSVL